MIKKVKFPDGSIKRIKVPDGMPEEQVRGIIQKIADGQGGEKKNKSWADGPGYKQTELRQEYPIRRAVSNAYRSVAEGVGVVAGGVTGAAAGPAGSVAGAGLGYAMMSNIADRVHESLGLADGMNLQESTLKAIHDVSKGATYEMGGQAAGKVIGGAISAFKKVYDWTKRTFGISDKAALRKAEDIYHGLATESPDALKTAKETDALLKRLDVKTKPTVAQRTGSTEAGMLEQSLARKPEVGGEIVRRRDAIRGEAQASLDKKMGTGSVSDAVSGVSKHQQKMQARVDAAKAEVDEMVNPIYSAKPSQEVGENLHTNLKDTKAAAKNIVDQEYAKIPEGIELSSTPVTKAVKKVVGDIKVKGGGASTVPSAIIKQITKKSKEGTVTFDQLRDWKSQIGEEIRDNIVGATPNLKLVRRLKMVGNGIDDAMDQMLKSDKSAVVEQYKIATDTFKKFHRKFRKGTVGEVLQPGNLSTGQKVGMTEIPGKFFSNADKADDLVNAVGQEKAAALMDDYVAFNLANKIPKGSNAVKAWIQKNDQVLTKFGLKQKYKDIAKTMEFSEKTLGELTAYNKTVASSVLEADVGKVIESVFTKRGAKMGSASAMNDLLNLPGIKGNEAAINGIKSAFKDFILGKSVSRSAQNETLKNPVHLVSTLGKNIDEYMPAMNVLYKGDMGKVRALKDYHKIMGMLERNVNVAPSGGPTTAEKLAGANSRRGVVESAMQFAAVKLQQGWAFSSLRNLIRAVARLPESVTKDQVDSLLVEAMLNPDLANTLMRGSARKGFATKINHHLITLGIAGAHNVAGDDNR